MGSCAAPSAKGDDKFITTDYLQQCPMNWGASKGLDHFQDVCIVMGSSHWKLLTRQELATLPPSSRNRLYVACSRARGNIYFVPETHLRRFRN
ncbi:hypothetical protein ELI64_30260 [Klebsiella pneumoniae]|nr:hypothetical protein [Klebsiella pneumoniae]MBL1621240.1 hypothetical protein [Klebsiella pneumoniae]MBL1793158.1 hypothetical protein [Klebsiella pneumoniae]MBL1940993.1 hypothetical protein [Klebsiella pneumoniae]MBL2032355.1 hypothetical protein [Klebsiella pneumoniae]